MPAGFWKKATIGLLIQVRTLKFERIIGFFKRAIPPPILDKSNDDTITWDGTLDRNYLVKNGYQTIVDWSNNANRDSTSTSGTSNDIRETLWQYNVPPKHNPLIMFS
jgi:hypothetical protein